MIKLRLFLISIILLGLNACSSRPNLEQDTPAIADTVEQRTQKINALEQWKIQGRIAFIQGKERESASLYWHNNLVEQKQELNLNTFLGINIFSLKSKQGIHQLEVDGEEYQSDDLAALLYSLTGLQLPVEQLHFWLFGLPAYTNDQLTFDPITSLPTNLHSSHNSKLWTISYAGYVRKNNLDVSTKLTIRQGDLLIKMQISDWTF